MIMTRRVTFSAARSRWIASLSQAENETLFGPGAYPEPFGNNFILDVSVRGRINPETGMLVNIKEIDRIVRERVVTKLDRRYINQQIPVFREAAPTLERLTLFIGSELAERLPEQVSLYRIRLEETPTRFAEWDATVHLSQVGASKEIVTKEQNLTDKNREHQNIPGMEMDSERAEVLTAQSGSGSAPQIIRVTRVYEFSASHRLHSPHLTDEENRLLFGKCNYINGHGHNYEVEVTVSGPIGPRSGQLVAVEMLDEIVNREVVERYDHRHLNFDIPEFQETIPSAEVITQTIWQRLCDHIPAPARLYRVLLRETARNIFEYYGEDDLGR